MTTRLDRHEPALYEGAPKTSRGTSTPSAFLAIMVRRLLREALSSTFRPRHLAWLASQQDDTHDAVILPPPERPPLLVAAFL